MVRYLTCVARFNLSSSIALSCALLNVDVQLLLNKYNLFVAVAKHDLKSLSLALADWVLVVPAKGSLLARPGAHV